MIINGNINNDNEDKEVDDMLALLQAIRDYVISIAEKRGFPSTIAMLRLDEILTACGSNDSNVSHENAVKMDKLSLFALGAAQVQGFTGEEYLVDFLPRLKVWDSYAVRLNGGLRFGGFPLHWC